VCRRILGPVYDNEKENWRILTNKEIRVNAFEFPLKYVGVFKCN
jgi:hypothetical protein